MSAKSPPPVPRAPAIALKLEAAREVLHQLEQDVGQLALEAAEGQSGANKRRADLRATIATAQGEVGELELAHTAALQHDADAESANQAAARELQFAAFKALADEWTKTGVELAGVLENAARRRVQFAKLTEQMQAAFPTGVLPYAIDFKMVDIMLGEVAMPVAVDVLLAGEMFKHGLPNAFLPGARAPVASLTYNQPGIEPAAAAFRRSGAHFIRLLRDRFDLLNAKLPEAA
jgi:hypothetical protein